MIFQKTLKRVIKNPRRLFLIDGLGALLSAVLIGIVLVRFEKYFGLPAPTLYFLASLPLLFAMYDLYCYRAADDKLGIFLNRIALMNLGYCVISASLAIHHNSTITSLGWIYIAIEILIIIILSTIEIKVAKSLTSKKLTSIMDKKE